MGPGTEDIAVKKFPPLKERPTLQAEAKERSPWYQKLLISAVREIKQREGREKGEGTTLRLPRYSR